MKPHAEVGRKLVFQAKVAADGVNPGARTVVGWANTETVDRYQELILASAFEGTIEEFLSKNAPMLWSHDFFSPPIGSFTELKVVEGKGLRFKAKFAETDFAKEIFSLFKQGHLRAFSVSFIPKKVRDPNEAEMEKHGGKLKLVIEEVELLEISAVTVPANADSIASSKGLDPAKFKGPDAIYNFLTELKSSLTLSDIKKGLKDDVTAAQELASQIKASVRSAIDLIDEGEEPEKIFEVVKGMETWSDDLVKMLESISEQVPDEEEEQEDEPEEEEPEEEQADEDEDEEEEGKALDELAGGLQKLSESLEPKEETNED